MNYIILINLCQVKYDPHLATNISKKRSRRRLGIFANKHVDQISLRFRMAKTIDQTSLLSLSFSLFIIYIFD